MPKNPADYILRETNPSAEMAHVVMVDRELEWCATGPLAETFARQALEDAKAGDYSVTVYVFKCLKQNGV